MSYGESVQLHWLSPLPLNKKQKQTITVAATNTIITRPSAPGAGLEEEDRSVGREEEEEEEEEEEKKKEE